MANYTEDVLHKRSKKDLISIILLQQRKIDQDIGWFDEICKLNDNSSKLAANFENCKKHK